MKTARFDEEQGMTKPSSSTEWLMMRHGEQPLQEHAHNDIVYDAMQTLSDQSQWILRAIYWEQITYQELGDRLGVSKPHAWRLAQKAVADLKNLLEHNPTLKGRYQMEPSWQDGCRDSLQVLLWDSRTPSEPLTRDMVDSFRQKLVDQFNSDTEDQYLWGVTPLAQAAWSRLWEEGFTPSVEGCCALLARKQHDYGHQNILSFMQRGIIVRLCDKLSRLENLDRKDIDPSNESLIDTLLDIIGYCTISRMLSADTFRLPLAYVGGVVA